MTGAYMTWYLDILAFNNGMYSVNLDSLYYIYFMLFVGTLIMISIIVSWIYVFKVAYRLTTPSLWKK